MPTFIRRLCAAGAAALWMLAALNPGAAFGWGATGHRMLSQVAAEHLPDEIPEFLRTPLAARQIGELGRELDRSKGAGKAHDTAWDPAHWVNLADDGTVLGAVALDKLPETREQYETALRRKHATQFEAGYLPYSILEGWQQLAKDFAYWRADAAMEQSAPTPEERAWFAEDRALRELITLRDLGVWSHYVGDASQPLHVTTHYNGWGPFENPGHFTTATDFHAHFEGAFVRKHVQAADVAARLPPSADCKCTIQAHIARLIGASNAQVKRVYELEQQGAFERDPAIGAAFIAERLAFGAAELRDLIVEAWRASLEQAVGYPVVPVRDVLSGKTDPYKAMRALD